jgi:hypothetical protein
LILLTFRKIQYPMNLLEFARQELKRRQAAGPIDVRTEAAHELERRRREILGSLTEWCRHCRYEPAAHHRLIIQELEALERGEFTNLAISAPPGSAKTVYVSHLFASWYLARNPTHLVLSGSHTQEFARR